MAYVFWRHRHGITTRLKVNGLKQDGHVLLEAIDLEPFLYLRSCFPLKYERDRAECRKMRRA